LAEIIQFIPRAELDAIGNLRGFIDSCRNHLTVFGADLDWDANEWDVTSFLDVRGRSGRLAFVFSNLETAGRNSMFEPMAQPFRDFAKGYMRYQHAMKPTKSFNTRMAALRALEVALKELSADGIPRVEKTDPQALNNAVQLIKEKNPGSSYQVANQLKTVAELLTRYRFTTVAFTWKNPVKKPDDHNIRVGKVATERRKFKLPSMEALDALAYAFHTATERRDIIITSIAALMTCSPDRINELFRLSVDCEHEAEYKGKNRYGLRWFPSKGAKPMIKWIPTPMVETAKNAVRKLKENTEEARRIAKWYEDNPGKLYLPPELEYLRDKEYLSRSEVEKVYGFASVKDRTLACKVRRKPAQRSATQIGVTPNLYSFEDIERDIVSMLPPDFPMCDSEIGLKYSEALILVPKQLFHITRGTYQGMFEILTTDAFNNQLGGGTKHGKSSVFSRMGLVDKQEEPFHISSHQFRHWLNTLAQKKNLDQMTIALWSGRKDVRQNRDYDHRTSDEILVMLREGDTSELSGVPMEIAPNTPVSREEYMEMKYPTVHTTPFGFCVHDWSMVPCQKHRACLDCTEHKCMKGDKAKTERIRQCLQDAREQLARDEEALAEGVLQADRWMLLNRKRVERLTNLVQIFDDSTVPEGTLIELTNENEYSPIMLAMNERQLLHDGDARMLKGVRALHGAVSLTA